MRYAIDFKNHLFTLNNFERYISTIVKQDISYSQEVKEPDFFIVKEEDSLFWSFYIIAFGLDKYIMNKGKNYIIQQELKINVIESMKDNKSILKQYKLKKVDIEQNLLYDKQITYASFLYLSMFYRQNIIIIDDRVYYECIGDPTNDTIIMIKKINHYYAIYTKIDKEYSTKYYKIDNISKPILGISSYKLNELQDICKKLKLNTDGKKKDLYEKIIKCIN
tara:strand:+ start:11343 stop:12005 length:663 start_codon:yes stop_codon:yes gene_type:complete